MNSKPETLKSSGDLNETRTYPIPSKEITWTVPDFEFLSKDADYSLDSPLFFFQNAVWCLRFYPNQKSYIGLYLVRLSSHVPHHRLQYRFESHDGCNTFCSAAADFDENHKENGTMQFMLWTFYNNINHIVRVTCRVSCYGTHVDGVFSQTRSLNGAQKNSKPEVMKSDGDFNQTETHLIPTKEITWTVPDFNSLPEDSRFSLDSPTFVFRKATWCLRLYLHQFPFDNIGLHIVRLSSHVPYHRFQYHFTSLDSEDKYYGALAYFDENRKEHGTSTFINKSKKHPVIRKNIFRVTCQILHYGSHDEDVFSQTQHFEPDMKDVENFSQNFKDTLLGQNLKNMLLNGRSHDLVLKVKDKEFRAHQDILRFRSPVLESMLSHDMIEKNSGVIDIPDCDPDAFHQFLLFIYGGEVETLDTGNMLALYYIADKYDVGYLIKGCREFIKKSLTYTNVSDAIKTALDHSDADLLEGSTDYFVKHVSEILPTVEWQSFVKCNPVQANELFIKATKNMAALINMS